MVCCSPVGLNARTRQDTHNKRVNTMTIKYNLLQTLNGKRIVNTLHYVDDPNQSSITPNETAELIAAAYSTHAISVLSEDWTLDEITYVDPDAGGGQPAVPAIVPALPIQGSVASASMSNRASALINWKASANAPWRGRMNVGGIYENGMQPGNIFDAAVQAAISALAFNLITLSDGLGGGAQLVLRSTNSNVIPAGTTSVVVTGTLNNSPKTIRSRG